MILLGAPGTGKTHFCRSLYNYIRKNTQIDTFRYWNENKLLGRLRSDMLEFGDFERCLTYLVDDQLIIFDDLGSTGMTDWRKTVAFSFVDQRYESQKPTVITSNMTKEIILQEFGERTHSRLFAKENTIIELKGADWRICDPVP